MALTSPQVDKRFSDVLMDIIRTIPADGLTLGELLERLSERSLLVLCMFLTIPFLLPVSIPGSSVPFGLVIMLNGIGIVIGRPPWLPKRFLNHHIRAHHLSGMLEKGVHLFLRMEKLMHPRLFTLTHGPTVGRLNAALLVVSGGLLMLPLPLPLSNTLPAYAVLFLAAGNLERDGYLVGAGYLMIFLSVTYLSVVAVLWTVGARAVLAYIGL
jgi:hypothetical protein